jgi:hypothetical protein
VPEPVTLATILIGRSAPLTCRQFVMVPENIAYLEFLDFTAGKRERHGALDVIDADAHDPRILDAQEHERGFGDLLVMREYLPGRPVTAGPRRSGHQIDRGVEPRPLRSPR